MEIEKLLSKLEKEDFIDEISKNKKHTKGNFFSGFSTNWRNKNSFTSKFLKIINEIDRGADGEWKQDNGQDKFKEHKPLFVKKMGLFVVGKNNVFQITKKGKTCHQGILFGGNYEFNDICFSELGLSEEIENLSKLINLSFPKDTLQSLIIKIKAKNSTDDENILTKISLIHDGDFVEYFSQNKDLSLILKRIKEKGVLDKYFNSKVAKNTILASLEVVSDYMETPSSIDANNINKRFVERKIKSIRRDKYEVLKVLERSGGVCEVCNNKNRQFIKDDRTYFSNVHHIVPIGKLLTNKDINKYDKASYMITLCPFHHSEVHHGKNREIFSSIIKIAKNWGLTENIKDNK